MSDTQTSGQQARQARIQEIVDGVKLRNGGATVFVVDSEAADEFYVYRRVNRDERIVYRKLVADDKRLDAQDALMGCVLWPEKDELAKRVADAPFVVETLADAILAASGVYVDAVRKKY